jgi:glycosyl transferase family 25
MHWLSIKIINLEHRHDRRAEAMQEMNRASIPTHRYSFVNAKNDAELPIRGCAVSHAYALADYLFSSPAPYALVLEDDFQIANVSAFTLALQSLESKTAPWDVLLLAHNRAVPIAPTEISDQWRVINAKTASAYIVSRSYAPRLCAFFFECTNHLTMAKRAPANVQSFAIRNYSHDIAWHSLQSRDNFSAVFPPLIIQRPSFSDIQRTHVNYGV